MPIFFSLIDKQSHIQTIFIKLYANCRPSRFVIYGALLNVILSLGMDSYMSSNRTGCLDWPTGCFLDCTLLGCGFCFKFGL